jgi:hypothetical protein
VSNDAPRCARTLADVTGPRDAGQLGREPGKRQGALHSGRRGRRFSELALKRRHRTIPWPTVRTEAGQQAHSTAPARAGAVCPGVPRRAPASPPASANALLRSVSAIPDLTPTPRGPEGEVGNHSNSTPQNQQKGRPNHARLGGTRNRPRPPGTNQPRARPRFQVPPDPLPASTPPGRRGHRPRQLPGKVQSLAAAREIQ